MIVYNREQMGPSVTGRYPNIDCLYNTIKRETREHMKRVGVYAEYLYRYLLKYYEATVRSQVPEEFDEVSEILFTYHDLGMTYVPGTILNKVQQLTDEEKQIIKNHTLYANDAVKAIYNSSVFWILQSDTMKDMTERDIRIIFPEKIFLFLQEYVRLLIPLTELPVGSRIRRCRQEERKQLRLLYLREADSLIRL